MTRYVVLPVESGAAKILQDVPAYMVTAFTSNRIDLLARRIAAVEVTEKAAREAGEAPLGMSIVYNEDYSVCHWVQNSDWLEDNFDLYALAREGYALADLPATVAARMPKRACLEGVSTQLTVSRHGYLEFATSYCNPLLAAEGMVNLTTDGIDLGTCLRAGPTGYASDEDV